MRFRSPKPVPVDLIQACWPVGCVFTSVVATDPADLLGFGVWQAIGAGRVLVGQDAGQAEFDTLGEEGGAKEVTLTAAQSGLPQHTHAVTDPGHAHATQRYPTATGGSTGFTADTSMSGTPVSNTLLTASAATGVTNQDAGPAAAAEAHTNMPPFLIVKMWKRVA